MQTTLEIYDINNFKDKVAEYNKKYAKYGNSISIVSLDVEIREFLIAPAFWYEQERKIHQNIYTVVIEYAPLMLGDYSLIAALNHKENLINLAPNESLDADVAQDYLSDCNCEHCDRNIKRNDTFIIRNNEKDTLHKVGRNCLALYTGIDAENILKMSDAYMFMSELTEYDDIEDAFFERAPSNDYVDLVGYLAFVHYSILQNGWNNSNSVAPTKEDAFFFMNEFKKEKQTLDKQHYDIAYKAISFVQQHTENSNYINNLQSICENQFVTLRSCGYAASIVQFYLTDIAKHDEKAVEQEVLYNCEVGARIEFTATVVFSYNFNTRFGTSTLYILEDTNGILYKWTTGTYLAKDTEYILYGTITEVEEYRDRVQTVVKRCKIVE